jgi:hypothetical protein
MNVNQMISTKNVMLTVIWRIDGFHVVDMMPLGRFNTEYFVTHVMDPLLTKVFPEGKKSDALRLSVHLDNCRVHFRMHPNNFNKDSLVTLRHLPHGPDLA